VQCYGCQKYGHIKKKGGVVNCPWWVVTAPSTTTPTSRPPTARAPPLHPVR
jgi:hypothetical protein